MEAYRRVYDSRHLQTDCQEPGSAPKPIRSVIEYWLPLPFYLYRPACFFIFNDFCQSIIISKSIGQNFVKFSGLVEVRLNGCRYDKSVIGFSTSQGTLLRQPFFVDFIHHRTDFHHAISRHLVLG